MKVGINGFGRIGKAIARINQQKKYFDLVAINDINPDNKNLAYQLKYDSTYGIMENCITANKKHLSIDDNEIDIYHKNRIHAVPWRQSDCDLVIDASGVHQNVIDANKLKDTNVRNVIVTHSPDYDLVDKHIIMGVNEHTISEEDQLISSSICDANAVAPTLKVLNDNFRVKHGFVTTMHPYLNYQNLLDGHAVSFGYPGTTYGQYELGRSSLNCLIPKPTSCISAVEKVLPHLRNKFQSMSFRTPTTIVSCADLSVKLDKVLEKDIIVKAFEKVSRRQHHMIFDLVDEPLVSTDFTKSNYSAIIDKRWIQVNSDYIKMIIWYDNEWGYSHRVVDLIHYLEEMK